MTAGIWYLSPTPCGPPQVDSPGSFRRGHRIQLYGHPISSANVEMAVPTIVLLLILIYAIAAVGAFRTTSLFSSTGSPGRCVNAANARLYSTCRRSHRPRCCETFIALVRTFSLSPSLTLAPTCLCLLASTTQFSITRTALCIDVCNVPKDT